MWTSLKTGMFMVVKEEVRNRNSPAQQCSLYCCVNNQEYLWMRAFDAVLPSVSITHTVHMSQIYLYSPKRKHVHAHMHFIPSSGFAVKLATNRRARLPPLWVDPGRIQFVRYYALICAHWPEKGEGPMILWPALAILLIITPVPTVQTAIR